MSLSTTAKLRAIWASDGLIGTLKAIGLWANLLIVGGLVQVWSAISPMSEQMLIEGCIDSYMVRRTGQLCTRISATADTRFAWFAVGVALFLVAALILKKRLSNVPIVPLSEEDLDEPLSSDEP